MRRLALSVLAVTMVGSVACKKSEPPPPPPPAAESVAVATPEPTPAMPTVVSVTLGNAIGADKRVTAPLEAFAAGDTIYASVETAGAGPTRLRTLWSYVRGSQTTTVDDTTIEIAGPGVSEFHIAKPSGWPKGDYKVDVFIGDQTVPAVTKTFTAG